MKQAFAVVGALVAAASVPAKADEHLMLLNNCFDRPISSWGDKVKVYSIQNAGDVSDGETRCLVPESVDFEPFQSGNHAIIYPSKFDHSLLGDGPPKPLKEAAIRAGGTFMVVTAPSSDIGVTRAHLRDSGQALIEVGQSKHTHTFLLKTESKEVEYLTDGRVELVEDGFRVENRKSYFKDAGGAFWFDAILNSHGRIVDIVTPTTGNVCMNRSELARRSSLALDKVASKTVCVRR